MVRKAKDPVIGEGITVTAQQSRFHVDSVEAPTLKEILVKDLSISINQRELLAHAELFLKEGGHYVLVGRNGTGKSTLLKALAEGMIPGIPWSFNILLLGQTTISASVEEDMSNLGIRDETVLQHVVRSDKKRERYMREASLLSSALESTTDPTKPVTAFRRITHERLELKMEESSRRADRISSSRRDGARGLKARKALVAAEGELEASQEKLGQEPSAIDTEEISRETQAATEMLGDVQSALELMDAPAAEAKARTVLRGLGFSVDKIEDSMSQLSGGWRTRCKIACALCQYPDILLLDEPTNFLDLPSIIWLQNYIQSLEKTTVVVVTHDRDFADAAAQELLVLRNQQLETFRGNLSLYEAERYKNQKYMARMKDAQEKQKKHIEATIQGNIRAAKRAGDDKKLKQAASRQKKLDDRMGLEVSAKGTRFKLNRDRAGQYGLSSRAEIKIDRFETPVRLNIPVAVPDLRFPGALVNLEKVSFAYPGKKRLEVLKEVSLTIHPGERIGLAGLNGSGKTTLVSLIIGSGEGASSTGGMSPTSGTITRHSRAKFARFSQDAVEELEETAARESQLTALADLMRRSENSLTEQEARGILGGLGLQGPIVSDVPIIALSGGQKVRLALAKLLWNPPHLLVLDEVTTHLDADTILALVLALRRYEGALLVVTHDRFFMRCVVEGESPYKEADRVGLEEEDDGDSDESDEDGTGKRGVVYRMFKGSLKLLEGGMTQYEEIASRASSKFGKIPAGL
ncbi:ABC transporter ATP-binding protein uup-1 [Rhizodiscina lignyota]|uniref:ABC transporter ATP-binding protein uup-1 n=1 Tax=Rhizodiscina lignyota TaxID=1504668 RepID=A0A9P4IFW4_9PEZI|nr:ABC transporter ATP-binding protein uup-1 [Rhizodiscina lignyota]